MMKFIRNSRARKPPNTIFSKKIVDEQTIEVLRILHERMDFKDKLNR